METFCEGRKDLRKMNNYILEKNPGSIRSGYF
jgi:hypothetical protein